MVFHSGVNCVCAMEDKLGRYTMGWIRRNIEEVVNLIEAIIRLAASLASLTSTPKDDSIVAVIKAGFGKVKGFLLGMGN